MTSRISTERGNIKIIIPIVLLAVAATVVIALRGVGDNRGYAPEQPLPFSHKLHAGQYNIPCMYCHAGVEKGKAATIPSVSTCMNCHAVVKPESPHIKKLTEHFQKDIPIEWIRVHDMPDHVGFNHRPHIAKGITCETCHGDVKSMDRIKQDKILNMGFCMDCHTGKTAPEFLKRSEAKETNQKGNGGLNGVPVGGVAPTTCYTCHH